MSKQCHIVRSVIRQAHPVCAAVQQKMAGLCAWSRHVLMMVRVAACATNETCRTGPMRHFYRKTFIKLNFVVSSNIEIMVFLIDFYEYFFKRNST